VCDRGQNTLVFLCKYSADAAAFTEEFINDAELRTAAPLGVGARDWEGAGFIFVCTQAQREECPCTGSPEMSPKQTYVAALVREVTDSFFWANCQFHRNNPA